LEFKILTKNDKKCVVPGEVPNWKAEWSSFYTQDQH